MGVDSGLTFRSIDGYTVSQGLSQICAWNAELLDGKHRLGFFGIVFGIGLLSVGVGGLILFAGSGR